MYRRTRKYQDQVDRMARARATKERKRFEECGHHPDKYPPELLALHKVIEITDFDSGIPVTHHLELYRTSRIDCHSVWIDGQRWKEHIGWSRILEGLLNLCLPKKRGQDETTRSYGDFHFITSEKQQFESRSL